MVTIAGTEYTETECNRCGGTGVVYDPTNADKVNPHPNGNRCPTCRGATVIRHMVVAPEIAAVHAEQDRRLRAALAENCDPTADLPDWMC